MITLALITQIVGTLSGRHMHVRMSRVLEGLGPTPAHDTLLCGDHLHLHKRCLRRTAMYRGVWGNNHLIGSTIVRSWMRSTAIRSCPLVYFSNITASIVDNRIFKQL